MAKYYQDGSGKWWIDTNRQRCGASMRICSQCKQQFPSRHPQKYCSRKCAGQSQKGNRLGERPCAWCKKPFIPKGKGNRQKCCCLRCAYDLGNTKRGLPGDRNPNWKGGVTPFGKTGYILQYVPGRGPVFQHRLVMEKKIGRLLRKGENVHHKNGIRDDNRPSNLELWVKKQPPGQRIEEQQHCATCTCHLKHRRKK